MLFCDGGSQGTQHINASLASHYPWIEKVYVQEQNLGIGLHMYAIRQFLFEELNLERVLIFEEDMVPGKYYYRTMHRALDWAQQQYPSIQCISSAIEYNEPLAELAALQERFSASTNMLYTRKWWETIREPYTQAVKDLFEGVVYTRRDIGAIYKWLVSKAGQHHPYDDTLPSEYQYDLHARFIRSGVPCSQDTVVELLTRLANLHRFTIMRPRARYVGMFGVHSETNWWFKWNYHKVDQFTFEEDLDRTHFLFQPASPDPY